MREQILSRTNGGLAVFRHYIRTPWRENRPLYNPLYDDTKASCRIYRDKKGEYRLTDFGNSDYSGDCFFFVGRLNGLECSNSKEFVEIMKIIDRDLALGCYGNREVLPQQQRTKKEVEVVKEPPPKKEYRIKQRSYTPQELTFWGEYGIGEDTLNRFGVVAIEEFESIMNDEREFLIRSKRSEPIFGYTQRTFVKIYRPYSSLRFMYGGETPEQYCFGLDQLPAKGDILFITGGEKDVLTLSSRGFSAISFNCETAQIAESIIMRLSFMFKHIVILYDMDKTGVAASKKRAQQLSEYGVKRMSLPLPGTKQAKDISDYFKMGHSVEQFRLLFVDLLDTIYSNTISILKSCEVSVDNPPQESCVTLSINGVPLGTDGNLLCISGGEGTGKSNFVGAIIAGAICQGEESIDTLGFTVSRNSSNRAVLLYDTEQSEAQLYKNSRNILRRAGLESMPEKFKAYSLTSMSRSVRLQSIIESMDRFYHYYGGIHLVVIDGIADLIRGANDEGESVMVVEELYRLAGIYNTTIIYVLHFLPSGLKLRGHLGSELQRKAAAILSIERDNEPSISVAKALKVRDGSPLDVPMVQFAWDKSSAMHRYVGVKSKEVKEQRKEAELTRVVKQIFIRSPTISYGELCAELQESLNIQERTAKSHIKYMRERGIVSNASNNSSSLRMGITDD